MVKFSENILDTSSIISTYLDQTFEQYSRHLETAPIFVSYYSRDYLNSTHDEFLETVQSITGVDSPNKFIKIQRFPLYGVSVTK